ncbi:MAG: ABC transporter permease [Candidatus Nanohaloarchaea archaeon]
MIRDYVAIAFRNLSHRKRRSWLTVVGIFIGIAAVVSLVSLGQGLQGSVQEQFQQIGSDKLFINPGGDQTQGQVTTSIKLTGEDLRAVENTQGVEQAAGIIYSSTPATYRDDQGFVVAMGVPAGEGSDLVQSSWAMTIAEGRELRENDDSSIVIGSQVANSVFEDDPGIRSKITIGGEKFRVVGILEPTGDPGIDRGVMMTREAARRVTGRQEARYDWIFADLQPGFEPGEVEDDVRKSLRRSRGVDEGEEDFTVSTQEDLLQSFNSILGAVRGVVIGIASISIVVGGVGIMNTMYTSVTERTREIGVMKAIGATNEQVMVLFLIESGILGLVGGAIGVTTGIALSATAAYAASQAVNIPIQPYIGLELVLGSLFFAFLIGTVSGVLPSMRAAKLQPADALRYE